MSDLGTGAATFGTALLAVAFLIAFAESGLGLGSFLPGEVLLVAMASALDQWEHQTALALTVVMGAWAGDHVGYVIGRAAGPRARESRAVGRLGVSRWDHAAEMLRRLGLTAVAVGRLTPLARTIIPVVAGAAGMRWHVFALGSAIGSTIWAALWIGLGATAGAASAWLSPVATIPAATLVVALWAARRRSRLDSRHPARSEARSEDQHEPGATAGERVAPRRPVPRGALRGRRHGRPCRRAG